MLEPRFAVRPQDLQSALLEVKPRSVHFCGHGEGERGLVLENDSGQHHLVSKEALADLFRHFSHQIECVLLNACYSQVQAKEIVKHINFVIGMRQPILDRSAIAFSEGFYGALGILGYFIFPFDLISDFIPVVGWTDDLGTLETVLALVGAYITPEVKEQATQKLSDWFGKKDEKKIEQSDVKSL